jgi:acetolactate synthase-1/2/3 large subunit
MSPPPAGPVPVVVDIPKDVQFATGIYTGPSPVIEHKTYKPQLKAICEPSSRGRADGNAKKPVIYTGGGVINSGRKPPTCCASWCA